jgi:hypothetical protein
MWSPFKKKQALTPAIPDSTELAYATAWGFTFSEWQALTDPQRRDYRDRVSYTINR